MSKSAPKRQESNGAQNDQRPNDCECRNPDDDLPCARCYIDGHDDPNPAAGDNECEADSALFDDVTPFECPESRRQATPGDDETNLTLLLETAETTIERLEGRDGDDGARIDVLEGHRDALAQAMMVR